MKRKATIWLTLLIVVNLSLATPGRAWADEYILPDAASVDDELGSVLAYGDFNADGFEDVVIAIPNTPHYPTYRYAGEVYVIWGSQGGLGGNRYMSPHTGALQGQFETYPIAFGVRKGPRFGESVAVGDFDGNGYDDLAVGAANTVSAPQKGQVAVIYSYAGLPLDVNNPNHVWVFDESDLGGTAEAGDQFGSSLAAGDFDGDGQDDLAIGIPKEDDGGIVDAGAVRIAYGSSGGLSAQGSVRLRQGQGVIPGQGETGDKFGFSLTSGDFDNDGYGDLAVSAPYEDHSSKTDPGSVWVFFGSTKGLHPAIVSVGILTQAHINADDDGPAHNEKFGWSMTAGDINGDDCADLVIGVPFEDTGGKNSAGEVDIFYGGSSGFASLISFNQVIDQDTGDMFSTVEAEDKFGYSVAVGDVDDDGYDDVVIGVPYEQYSGHENAGMAHVLFGNLIALAPNSHYHREDRAPGGNPAEDDRWGRAVLLADSNGDGRADLFVGVPGKNLGVHDMGVVPRVEADGSADGFDYYSATLIRKRL